MLRITSDFVKFSWHKLKPLLSLIILYPLAFKLSSHIIIDGVQQPLYNLKLPLLTAFIIIYRGKAFPPVALITIYCLFSDAISQASYLGLLSQISSAFISCWLYFYHIKKRRLSDFGRSKRTIGRVLWLAIFNSVLYMLVHSILVYFYHITESPFSGFQDHDRIISFIWLITACVTALPLCNIMIKGLKKPSWIFNYFRLVWGSVTSRTGVKGMILWFFLLAAVMVLLISTRHDKLIFTSYSVLLLLPIFLWSEVYIGSYFSSPLWAITLILLGGCSELYESPDVYGILYFEKTLTTATLLLIFSLMIIIVERLVSRNRSFIKKLMHLGLTEMNTGLPNLEALKRDLDLNPNSGLCLIYCPELWALTHTYGLEFRFEFIKELKNHLLPAIHITETIYYYPGYGLFIRQSSLNIDRIYQFYDAVECFRFSWDDRVLGIQCGIGFMQDGICSDNILITAGKLNSAASLSLISAQPEVVKEENNKTAADITSTVQIRYLLQKTVDQKSFVLFAQPIISTKGKENYYEILIRMRSPCNNLIYPDVFLPVANKAELTAQVDMTVIEQTFKFMFLEQKKQRELRFSINLMPRTLCTASFIHRVKSLFHQYQISPNCIIFEIIESDILDNELVLNNLQQLRLFGCKIAIDDFGAGYASHSRLKNIDADILKIDGSFVRNILESRFDHHTVVAFHQAAHILNMQVVAEYVENEDIKQKLINIGIEWLQGYHIGKPGPIEELLDERT